MTMRKDTESYEPKIHGHRVLQPQVKAAKPAPKATPKATPEPGKEAADNKEE